MKKLLCLLLCLLTVLSLAACGEKEVEETQPQETTTETQPETSMTVPTEPEVAPLDSFYMDYKEADQEEAYYLQAYPNGDGTAFVEYKTASGRKQANLPDTVMVGLAQLYEGAEMKQLNGIEVYEDGDAVASIYISRGEEACSYSYYGAQVPEEYKIIFDALAAAFGELMADVPEYVAKPQLGEGVNEAEAAELEAILAASGITNLDTLGIMNVAKDEYFGYNAGLSGAEGIESCTSCTALMMTVPYSMVVVTAEEGADLTAIADDFAKSIDWHKWVCVQPSNATIATKDNMVLCLLGQDEMYFGTVEALEETGWTVVQQLKNNM